MERATCQAIYEWPRGSWCLCSRPEGHIRPHIADLPSGKRVSWVDGEESTEASSQEAR
jgi:hypothetical protein